MHFGVPGMKWGQRKRSQPRLLPGAKTSINVGLKIGKKIHKARAARAEKPKMSTAKKAAIGGAVLAGTAAAAYLLSKRGNVPVSRLSQMVNSDGSSIIRVSSQRMAPPKALTAGKKVAEKLLYSDNFSMSKSGFIFDKATQQFRFVG